jgi:hypothetical protein
VIEQKSLPLRAAYPFGIEHGLEREIASIKDMVLEWDLAYTSSLRKAFVIDLFQKHGLYDQFKTTCWQYGNTPQGERRTARYLSLKTRYEDFLAGRTSEPEGDEIEDVGDGQSFAQEADLRDFLAKNPNRIEAGLTLYNEGGVSGVEYQISDGRIDILAKDKNDRFVVIELKVGRGRNRTIGQLLYYMGWVDKHLADGKPCRGMIIARDIPDDLVLAAQRVPGVILCRYNLNVTVEAMAASPSGG